MEDRLYVDVRAGRHELTLALLVDVSASTDSWVSGTGASWTSRRRRCSLSCEALTALGDRHAIFAFSGEGPECVSVTTIKGFAERAEDQVRRRVAALDADGYARVGAAVRHATAALSRQPSSRRLLLPLSDGKPNDVDVYEGAYGTRIRNRQSRKLALRTSMSSVSPSIGRHRAMRGGFRPVGVRRLAAARSIAGSPDRRVTGD